MQNKNDLPEGNVNKPAQRSETISELAHRHLEDQNHITTEDELRNARIEFSTPPPQDDENLFEVDNSSVFPALSAEDDSENSEDDKDEKSHPPNPYDLLAS